MGHGGAPLPQRDPYHIPLGIWTQDEWDELFAAFDDGVEQEEDEEEQSEESWFHDDDFEWSLNDVEQAMLEEAEEVEIPLWPHELEARMRIEDEDADDIVREGQASVFKREEDDDDGEDEDEEPEPIGEHEEPEPMDENEEPDPMAKRRRME